jgi:hypothetical protein
MFCTNPHFPVGDRARGTHGNTAGYTRDARNSTLSVIFRDDGKVEHLIVVLTGDVARTDDYLTALA